MNDKKAALISLMTYGLMPGSQPQISQPKPRAIIPTIPKGTKVYYFNESGEIVEVNDSVFKCIASNKKNAIRKFNQWKLKEG